MTAARYWRVRFWDTTGAGDIWLAEVEFLDATDAVRVPPTVFASSVWSSSYSPEQAFDGIYTSGDGWASASKECWIGGDYGVPVEVKACRLWMGWQSSAWDELPLLTAIALECSQDNVVWTEVTRSATGENVVGGVVMVRPLPPPDVIGLSRAAVACSASVGDMFVGAVPGAAMVRDVEFGGAGRIFGTTKSKASPSNLPTKARVVLLHQRSKLLVRETWSDPDTGDYSFDGLDLRQEFLALAEDAGGNFRAVAAQRLLPGDTP